MARAKRATRVTKEQIVEQAERMRVFNVKWSRPGLDNVRVGKGYARGTNADGSLTLVDEYNGSLRAIMPEYVQRQVRVETKRSIRNVWRKWSDEDTVELLDFVNSQADRPDDGEDDCDDDDDGS